MQSAAAVVAWAVLAAAPMEMAPVNSPGQRTADLVAPHSRVYYLITESTDYGEKVQQLELLPHDTVLDALSTISVSLSKMKHPKIWVTRPRAAPSGEDRVLSVDWQGIAQRGEATTNYELRPGDRLYVLDEKWWPSSAMLQRLGPLERAETALADVGRFFLDAIRHLVGH